MKTLVRVALAAVLCAVFALSASAQQVLYTGRIDVSVVDSTGAVMKGATVEVSGVGVATIGTDDLGQAHFLGLAPGKYTVTVKKQGFTDYVNQEVQIGAGLAVPLKVTMSVGGVAEKATVTASTPIIDPKKETVSTNFSLDSLQKIPSSRDPWVVLQQVPGVIVDRVNVGSAESGQQSNYQAKGASGGENTWTMDGIPITDMAALGSSPTYYDFDMFQDMSVTTGGADLSVGTPGVALNFVLRSGTNTWRASARTYFESNGTQWDNLPTALSTNGQLQSYNRTHQYTDYGAEGGGPVAKDKVFVWGAYGKTHPENEIFKYQAASGNPLLQSTPACQSLGTTVPSVANTYEITARDCTVLENVAFKVTGQVNSDTRANFTYFRGNKLKFGRGASNSHPDETTWNQSGPTSLYKGEVNRTLSNQLFVSARFGYTAGGFHLAPRGGLNTPVYLDANGVWHGSYIDYLTDRPQYDVSADGNYFSGKHELKFGFGWRKAVVTSHSSWPGGGISLPGSGSCDGSAGFDSCFEAIRDYNPAAHGIYMNGFVSDTISMDRLTLTGGVRWDRQASSLDPYQVPANQISPILPELSSGAVKNVVVWNSIVPRVGASYALDSSRKTLLRASYAMFASQMNATQATVLSTIQYSYVYYNGNDLNGDNILQKSELDLTNPVNATGFDSTNPTSLTTPNRIGKYKTPLTHEIVLGMDRQVARDFGVSGAFTWRKYTNFDWYHLTGVDGTDYSLVGTYACTTAQKGIVGPCSVPYYKANPGALPADDGRTFESRPNYWTTFKGGEVTATKRMANNWMMRAGWSTNINREYFSGLSSILDPTPLAVSTSNNLGANQNGGVVVTETSGSGKSNIFLILPRYQFTLQAAYQAVHGLTFGANYLFRQGYAMPYFTSSKLGFSGASAGTNGLLLTGAVDNFRLPNVHSLDARIGEHITYQKLDINIDVDIFNLFNNSTILGRQYDLNVGAANKVTEIMNPRIIRFGVRIGY